MIIRNAYFEGIVENKDQTTFDNFIINELVPLINKFPLIKDVKILKNIWTEKDAPPIYLVLQLTFDSIEAMELALGSPERAASKAKAEEIIPLLKGRVYHMNFKLL